jgi:EAL domain-containing protein (putative c-di-GMP-specific phosphodiesterase class I)
VGVAYAGPGDTADELLRNADVALYAAKSDGKDRHAVFAPAMHAAILSRLELEADLRRAVGRLEHGAQHEAEHAHGGADQGRPAAPAGGFRLVYQPIVEVASGGVVAVEALIRWTRPDGTAVPPADFVPIAEATGLVIPLGRWVLAEACAQAAAWRTRGGATAALRVTVNVSGRQLADCAALADDVATALARSGLPAECLTLEMTESVLMQRTGETLERLAALKALGVRLAIDDFGTGYSSLAYLQRFPVDVLKIDKAFVDGVADEAGDRAIARTVVALGRSLGLVTVAEGVEREDQWAALAELGCDYAQGYLFDRPLEVAAIPGRAAAGRRHVAG